MGKIKKFFKEIVPPFFLDLVLGFKPKLDQAESILWSGPYSSWEDASKNSTGYDQAVILDRCKSSLLKVKNGEAVYERDSVIFDEIQYSWPVLASLQKVALENNGSLRVLDFGGSLGSSYFQNRPFLSSLKELSWSIVEQEHFVTCGKELFQNSELKFYHSIEQCLGENKIDVLLLSSVVQYLEDPIGFFEKILGHKLRYIVFDRTTFTDQPDSKIMLQSVPETIYSASYPCWFMSESKFKALFSNDYHFGSEFESLCDGPSQIINDIKVSWKGFLLEAKY